VSRNPVLSVKISAEAIAAVKRRHDLLQVARASGVEMKRAGRQWVGLCPFHREDTPSFFVDPQKQVWNCLGACGANGRGESGGDLFRFVMKRDGVDFLTAWKKLGGEMDTTPLPPPRKRPAAPRPAPSLAILERVADLYHRRFLETAQGPAYLASRGITDPELYRAFRIGYVDGALLEKVPKSGKLRDDLLEVGVLNVPDGANGPVRELLAGCVVFPLLDAQGAVVNLYGRAVDRDQHLYLSGPRRGLWNAPILQDQEEIILTESVIDALSLISAGVVNVLPLYGSNGWTSEHEALLARLRPARIALALDADGAGAAAVASLTPKLKEMGLEVRVIELARKDPSEVLVRDGAAILKNAVTRVPPLASGAAAPVAEAELAKKENAEASPVTVEGSELRYASENRLYVIRCGESRGSASLRVALKLTVGDVKVIDTVDLYSARSRNAFLARAEALKAGERSAIERDLFFLLEAIERQQSKSEEPKPEPLTISPQDRAEALAFLRRPDLLDAVAQDCGTLGYVGEETNKQIGYLVAVSRKLEEPLSMVIMSQSGSGKSALADVLETLTPPEDVILFSRLTSQALYYMDRDALARKFILIEERAGSMDADYSIRTLQSKKRLLLAVPIKDPSTGRIKTQVFEILGPAAFLETTTESRIHHENSTRCFETYCDESQEQTRRIHEAQKRSKTAEGRRLRSERQAIIKRHHNAQRLLEPVGVEIPFAPLISFPHAWLRTRRDHFRFLNLIEAIAFLHQHQREKKTDERGEPCVGATVADYERAYRLAGEVLGQALSDLKRPAAELLGAVKELLTGKKDATATRREIREATGLPDHRVIALLGELVALEYLEVVIGSQGRTFRYRLAKDAAPARGALPGLTTPAELRKKLAALHSSRSSSKAGNFVKPDSKFSQRSLVAEPATVNPSQSPL
jgi:DNA primase catalytic core